MRYTLFNFKIWQKNLIHASGVICFYTLLFCIYFSPVLFSGKLLAPGDGLIYYVPAFQWGFDLWNQYLLSGWPQFADPQAMMWYLPRVLFRHFSWNLFVLFAYVTAAVCTYGYTFKLTKNVFAALFAGVTFSMSGFFITHLGHATIIHAASWLPLILWGVEELRKGYSTHWFVITGFAVALCILAGHTQITTYSLGLAVIYILSMAWGVQTRFNWKFVLVAGSAVVVGILLSSIQLLPTLEMSGQSLRSAMDFKTFVSYSLPPWQALALLFPYLFGGYTQELDVYSYFGAPNMTELSGYVGWLPLLMVGWLVFTKPKDRFVLFWSFIAVLSFLLTLGDATPLAQFMYKVPGYNLFRAPGRHFLEFSLALSILGSLAISNVYGVIRGKWSIVNFTIPAAFFITSSVTFIYWYQDKISKMAREKGITLPELVAIQNITVTVPVLFALLSIILIIWLSQAGKKSLPATVILLLLIVDLSSYGWFYEWKYSSPPTSNLRTEMKNGSAYQRIAPLEGYLSGVRDVVPNMSQMVPVYSISGYGPLMLRNYHELSGVWQDGGLERSSLAPQDRSLDILAVKYLYVNNALLNSTHPESAVPADKIGIASKLSNSTDLPNGIPVANLQIIYTDNTQEVIPILTGRDVSEWAYDRADLKNIVKHSRANIFESYNATDNTGTTFTGYWYLAEFSLAKGKSVQGVYINKLIEKPVEFEVKVIGLSNSQTSKVWQVTTDFPNQNAPSRWHYFKTIKTSNIYENLKALPRAWVVGETIKLPPESILNTIKTSRMPDGREYNPAVTALVEEDIPIDNQTKGKPPRGRVKILKDGNDRMVLEADMSQAGFLIVSNVNYPGWRAYLDGMVTPLFQTNYALQGLKVPKGKHHIELSFEPKSFARGRIISGVTLLFCLLLLAKQPFHSK